MKCDWKTLLISVVVCHATMLHSNASQTRRDLLGSIVRLEGDSAAGDSTLVVRDSLTAHEKQATMSIEVELMMRDLDELRSRIARGEILSRAEMLERYYPTQEAHAEVSAWLAQSGFELHPEEGVRLSVRARHRVEDIARTLRTRFVRVRDSDGREFTAAASTPSMPNALARHVVAIGGLQPHIRAKPQTVTLINTPFGEMLHPQVLRDRYKSAGFSGNGQCIAVMGGQVDSDDLVEFWRRCDIKQSPSNVTNVNIGWSPTAYSGAASNMETTGDVEWASAMAPGARIRVYLTVDPRQFSSALLNDMASDPGLRQATMSFALNEIWSVPGIMRAQSQYFTALAAEGLSMFVASGDGGSTDVSRAGIGGYYDPDGLLSVVYPASDPCVTAVGGTLFEFDSPANQVLKESAFGIPVVGGVLQRGGIASGGGYSVVFQRSAWQQGQGVPSGDARCVPDVSAIWGTTIAPAYMRYAGSDTGFGGTSLSSPVWSGLCALLNQARASAGLGPVGLLGPRIYPLIGTDAFNDVVEGTNGAYHAGIGYDLCSGIGTPNIEKLAAALVSDLTEPPRAALPRITVQPESQSISPGTTVRLTVVASSDSPMAFRWMLLPSADQNWGELDGAPWRELIDDNAYSGTRTSTLTITNAEEPLSRGMYQCQVMNSFGIALTTPAILIVDPARPLIEPKVTRPPGFGYVYPGQTHTFSVGVAGTGPFTYQWYDHNHVAIPDAISASFTLSNVMPADAGSFWVLVSGPGGNVESACGIFVITNPTITSPDVASGTVNRPFLFTVTAMNYNQTPNRSDYTTDFQALGLPPGLSINRASGAISGIPTAVGNFQVHVSGSNELGSDAMVLTIIIRQAGVPEIVSQPHLAAASVSSASLPTYLLSVAASGGDLSYQWFKDGKPLANDAVFSGVTTDVLSISTHTNGYSGSIAGSYTVTVSNSYGNVTSNAVPVSVQNGPLVLAQPPHMQSVVAGTPVWLSVHAMDWVPGALWPDTLSYQWYRDGVAIPGATQNAIHLVTVGSDQAGDYTVRITGARGSVMSRSSRVDVRSNSRLANISTRSWVGRGEEVQIAGFVVSGSVPKTMLIRAAGPALSQFGVAGVLGNPLLELRALTGGNAVSASNDDWTVQETDVDEIEAAAARVGAFPWARGSTDSALLVTLDPGIYTAIVRGAGDESGVALVEVYDADTSSLGSRLVNISTRSKAKSGDDVMIAGFVIAGSEPKTVLIRGIGPALTSLISEAVLPDPVIWLHGSQPLNAPLGSSDNWSADVTVAARLRRSSEMTGAFSLASDSFDAGMVVTLPPGVYTVTLSDRLDRSGLALVELYDVP